MPRRAVILRARTSNLPIIWEMSDKAARLSAVEKKREDRNAGYRFVHGRLPLRRSALQGDGSADEQPVVSLPDVPTGVRRPYDGLAIHGRRSRGGDQGTDAGSRV